MKYSYEYKRKCVEMYRSGEWPETPDNVQNRKKYRDMIRDWFRIEEENGPEALRHKGTDRKWLPEEKLELVSKVIAGASIKSVAIEAGINNGLLYQWLRRYKNSGYNGLINQKKGSPSKKPDMKEKVANKTKKLEESEYEELVRLRAENEYIKTEIEVLKKEIAQGEKAEIVRELREDGYKLKYLLPAIGLARSTYYFELRKEDPIKERNKELTTEIRSIFEHHKGRYGVRRVYMELVNRGFKINHKRVQRIMHEAGLEGKRPREKYHSYQGNVGKVADNIINRDFSTNGPLQKWTTDISQFSFPWGKCYLSPILDMHTNEIIAYDLSQSPNMEQIHRMLDRAFRKFSSFTGLILHSDQGWQYQHFYFRNDRYVALGSV